MTLSRDIRDKVIELSRMGMSKNRIAKELNISWDSVKRILEENKVKEDKKMDDIRKKLKNIEYREELEEMLIEVEASTNIKHKILKEKIRFLLEQDEIDDDIFKEIRNEYKSLGYLLPYERLKIDYENLRKTYNTLEVRTKDLRKVLNYKNKRLRSLDEQINMTQLVYQSLKNKLTSLQYAAVLPCPNCNNNIILPYNSKEYMNLLELTKNSVMCNRCRDNKRFIDTLLSLSNIY